MFMWSGVRTDDSMNRPRELSGSALAAYDLQWRRFVDRSLERGIAPLPATAETVEAYIGEISGSGSRVSTVKVTAAAIAGFHVDEALESPCANPRVQRTLAEMADREPPFPGQSKPLDLDCYLVLRETGLQ